MKICLVCKYPPIQGGVSMRSYRYAHLLGRAGHEVHVVTNADEVRPPFRMFMRPEDWDRCDATCDDGSVTVHWTEPADFQQYHIPMASPFVSKLASLGLTAAADAPFDAVFSFYAEPYAVAGHMIASMLGVPHIVKTAGSDAGRLWKNEQLGPLYDHLFRSADAIIAGGVVADNMVSIGVERSRCYPERDVLKLAELFTPDGPVLDVEELCATVRDDPEYADQQWGTFHPELRYIGAYGKLGETKGTFALLEAVRKLVDDGRPVGLLVMGHGRMPVEKRFRTAVSDLGLEGRVCQLPFLPHWRVPEFLRRCEAVTSLEQGFPIEFHGPVMPREILTAGSCLIGSTEVIRKLPSPENMVHGYNCLAVNDVLDIRELAACIDVGLQSPSVADAIGRRGREYAEKYENTAEDGPSTIERVLARVLQDGNEDEPDRKPSATTLPSRASLSDMIIEALGPDVRKHVDENLGFVDDEVVRVDTLFDTLDGLRQAGNATLAPYCDAVRLDRRLMFRTHEKPGDTSAAPFADPLFRLNGSGISPDPFGNPGLAPYLHPGASIERFNIDINQFLTAKTDGRLPDRFEEIESWLLFPPGADTESLKFAVLDPPTARVLGYCDGSRTVPEIVVAVGAKEFPDVSENFVAEVVKWFFESGMLDFREVGVTETLE